jgi:hypothetical protein
VNRALSAEPAVGRDQTAAQLAYRAVLPVRKRAVVEVDAVDGKSCYVYVQDELGHYDVIELPSDTTQDVVNDGGGSISNNNTDTTNPLANTDLGKIILIVLVAVLVLAAVLVIVQKIVDHKRRLY